MIFDKQTLAKCSLEQLKQFEAEHKAEIEKLLKEWLELDQSKNYVFTVQKVAHYEWHVKAATERLKNIHVAIIKKSE